MKGISLITHHPERCVLRGIVRFIQERLNIKIYLKLECNLFNDAPVKETDYMNGLLYYGILDLLIVMKRGRVTGKLYCLYY